MSEIGLYARHLAARQAATKKEAVNLSGVQIGQTLKVYILKVSCK